MPKRVIVSRQATAQIVGPAGPVDVGKWDEVTISNEIETLEHKPIDGTTEYLVEGQKYSGTLKRGEYDGGLAELLFNTAHPGETDPARHLLVVTTKYNDGSTQVKLFKEVLFSKLGESIARGNVVTEDLDWVAEDMEILT